MKFLFTIGLTLMLSLSFVYSQHIEKIDINAEHPKNIILLIGDGMGYAQIEAAQLKANETLNMLKASYSGSTSTHSYNNLITDSGAAGTAIATGKKTRNGMIGMTPDSIATPSMLEIFGHTGKSTGIVVSCAITHATPAAFVAKNVSRNNQEQIAEDFLKAPIHVIIGGGLKYFNKRSDKKTLTDAFQEKGFQYFNKLPKSANSFEKLLVLTDSIHPKSVLEGRGDLLPEGTRLALESLNNNPNGFFLMVEGSQIDWAGHANDSTFLTAEMFDFDKAVGIAMQFADKNPGTLVIITADHETGGLTLPHGNERGKVKFAFSTTDHTGVFIPALAYGLGADKFSGFYDNVDLFRKIMEVSGVRLE